ncbi:hypothetical protein Sjap_008690 [Stephania japonica]|uniref:Uncharacterized protein n=1 Tax=Stephania japonica TaxID=461633 RepID=A0AAP0JQ08_9MAGN
MNVDKHVMPIILRYYSRKEYYVCPFVAFTDKPQRHDESFNDMRNRDVDRDGVLVLML